jgi:fusaric acid resistance family protein
MPRMKLWSWQKENLPSITHSVRTALAATASVIVARLVQMPEAYWAAIATLVVMQSSLAATLTLSIERVVATALGASVGAVEVNYFGAMAHNLTSARKRCAAVTMLLQQSLRRLQMLRRRSRLGSWYAIPASGPIHLICTASLPLARPFRDTPAPPSLGRTGIPGRLPTSAGTLPSGSENVLRVSF